MDMKRTSRHNSNESGRVLRSRSIKTEDKKMKEVKAQPRTPTKNLSLLEPTRQFSASSSSRCSRSIDMTRSYGEQKFAEGALIHSHQVVTGKGDCSSGSTFQSCLSQGDIERDDFVDSSPKGLRPILLRRALSIQELDDDSWLSSSLIDLVIGKFSKAYNKVHFMSIDFVALSLRNKSFQGITDISGCVISYEESTPIVFIINSEGIHWQCIRVQRDKGKECLELFEPMGKPEHRHGGLGSRDVPRCVIEWLNSCCPLEGNKSWLSLGVSAITERQQLNSHDCGVAALLYAERCGLGHTAEEINTVTQDDLSAYRQLLKAFTSRVQQLD